jgi:hypothetical protein
MLHAVVRDFAAVERKFVMATLLGVQESPFSSPRQGPAPFARGGETFSPSGKLLSPAQFPRRPGYLAPRIKI